MIDQIGSGAIVSICDSGEDRPAAMLQGQELRTDSAGDRVQMGDMQEVHNEKFCSHSGYNRKEMVCR